ncbi:MAG: TIGR02301 family protein [Methyloceanibacter sp.]
MPKKLIAALFGAAWASMVFASSAEAQFFWFFDQPKTAPKPRKARPPADDLPPIVPRESTAPPPPDDRPYDDKLMRLAEILGAIHYLRELCGAQEGQVWREQMKEILRNEGTTAVRRAKLVNAFNDGYRGYRRTYRTCTQSATLATNRFSTEGATIAAALAQNSTFASKAPTEGTAQAAPDADQGAPAPGGETGLTDAGSGAAGDQAAAPAPQGDAPGPQEPEPPD